MCVTVASPSAATATFESCERAKSRLADLYLDQLLRRPKPKGRSENGWGNIINTAIEAFRNRLESLHDIESILKFALKCLKDQDDKECFLFFVVEDIGETCIPFEDQVAFVHSTSESLSFERDLSVPLVFEQSLNPSQAEIDLTSEPESPGAEPSSSSGVFQVHLQDSADVLDLY